MWKSPCLNVVCRDCFVMSFFHNFLWNYRCEVLNFVFARNIFVVDLLTRIILFWSQSTIKLKSRNTRSNRHYNKINNLRCRSCINHTLARRVVAQLDPQFWSTTVETKSCQWKNTSSSSAQYSVVMSYEVWSSKRQFVISWVWLFSLIEYAAFLFLQNQSVCIVHLLNMVFPTFSSYKHSKHL